MASPVTHQIVESQCQYDHGDKMDESKHEVARDDLRAESKRERSACLRWKDKFKNIKVYVILAAVFNNNVAMFWAALTGILTSIERRYSFDSATTGRLLMAAEIGPLVILLLVSHFSNRFNMPRITAGLYMIFAVTVALMTLPHYILQSDTSSSEEMSQVICMSTNATCSELDEQTQSDDVLAAIIQTKTSAFAIFYAALFVIGVVTYPASTLQFSYLESNTAHSSTVRYIALAGIGESTGPILGLFLSAWALSLYVDLSDTQLVDKDPAWVGAWWMVLVIIALCILIPSPLLCFFPRTMRNKESVLGRSATVESNEENVDNIAIIYTQESNEQEDSRRKEVYSLKGFFLSMRRLLTQPAYLMIILAYIYWALAEWGFGSFTPKYYQTEFNLSPWEAAIATGLTGGIGGTLGRILSAAMASYFKVSLRKGFIISILGMLLIVLSTASRIFVGCENHTLRGQPADGGNFIMDLSCADGCSCSNIPYTPVCDAGVTYFSPCHAGCTYSNSTPETGDFSYGSCNCTETGAAVRGICETGCNMFIPYIATVVFTCIVSAFVSPFLTVFTMRCVDPIDKTLAYGLIMFLTALAGFLPGPTLYGAVIDTTCTVWQHLGGGILGGCWQYDLVSLRYRLQGLRAGCLFLELSCYLIVYFLARNKFEVWEKRSAAEDDEIMNTPSLKTTTVINSIT